MSVFIEGDGPVDGSTVADRINVARKRADFRTLRGACLATGIKEERLAAIEFGPRESGRDRSPTPAELAKIAETYGTSVADLTGATSPFDRQPARSWDRKTVVGLRRARMTVARHMVGLPTYDDFARHFGWKPKSIAFIENNGSDRTMVIYAKATGTNPDWLKTGEGPSGYGKEVDDYVARSIPDVDIDHPALRNVDPTRRGDRQDVESPSKVARPYVRPQPRTTEGDASVVRWGLEIVEAYVRRAVDGTRSQREEVPRLLEEMGRLHSDLVVRLATVNDRKR